MAQKAAKQLAARNTTVLNRAHLISLGTNIFFILFRLIFYRASCTRLTYILYIILSAPSFIIEFWLEKIGRPTTAPNSELKKSGEDLEAEGLTEYLWDVLYWTWGCIGAASVIGDKAWWMWIVVPLYSAYLAFTTFTGMRKGMGGMMGQGDGVEGTAGGGESKRQKKIEKRGGQKMQYR